jgi:hypothetical protein
MPFTMTIQGQPASNPTDGQVTQAPPGFAVQIHRDQCKVHIVLTAQNEYASIELFDRLEESARQGAFNLGATTVK